MKEFFRHKLLRLKIWKYKFLSASTRTIGKPTCVQPLLTEGVGKIHFHEKVRFGVIRSPYVFSGYGYVEARGEKSEIVFEENVVINNSCVITAEKKITIAKNTVIGYNCHISDSSFHNLDPEKRHETDPNPEAVHIDENVFIGNNVTILKGVHLGKNVVVGSGAVVTKSFPNDVVIAGVPARVVSELA